MRCVHEEIVRLVLGFGAEELSAGAEAGEYSGGDVACVNCSKRFNSKSGGRCKHCSDPVQYCSVTCQVKIMIKHIINIDNFLKSGVALVSSPSSVFKDYEISCRYFQVHAGYDRVTRQAVHYSSH